MQLLKLLIYLAKEGALARPIAVTTCGIAKDLGISQQSVSRWLKIIERKGYTDRQKGIRGHIIQITPKGRKLMVETRNGLMEALSGSNRFTMKGRVAPGMNEGGYYVAMEEYSAWVEGALGFKPFPGTLNVRLNALEDSRCKEKMQSLKGVYIPPFKKGRRQFGSLKCFPCLINGAEGAVIIPERSHYGSDVLEVISPFNLRDRLGLSDGDRLKVEVIGYEKL